MVTIEPMPTVEPQRVLLVGFQDQDNLGLRYLMSAVKAAGHGAEIITYGSDSSTILDRVREFKPDVVGFSLIFQYMTPEFARVIAELRKSGVTAHFTIGGHYASFEPAQVLQIATGLDSVVLFDGELTLVGLLNCLGGAGDWRDLTGIAWQDGDEIKIAPLAKPVSDLDALPWPDRTSINYENHLMPTASVLGSRGCTWNCSFCSIRPFYEKQGAELRRLRDPRSVVDEMLEMYHERGVPIFLFQDDDFLAGGKRGKRWAVEIADRIRKAGLTRKIAFKISCRSDEIDEEIIGKLIAGGLTHVYMGVESGDEQGLRNMNKHLKPESHLRAGRILRKFGLSFDFGFMLLEPYSTIDMLRNNISFLEEFIGDGWSVAPFCRMLPYAGTAVKQKLEAEGRLLGTPYEPDYHFQDPKIDLFYNWMVSTFYTRNFTNQGLCHILRGLLFEARLQLDAPNRVTHDQRLYIEHLTALCNRIACYTLRSAIDFIERTPLNQLEGNSSYLDGLMEFERKEEERLLKQVMQYHEWVLQTRRQKPGPAAGQKVPGAFENSWTLATGDRRVADAATA